MVIQSQALKQVYAFPQQEELVNRFLKENPKETRWVYVAVKEILNRNRDRHFVVLSLFDSNHKEIKEPVPFSKVVYNSNTQPYYNEEKGEWYPTLHATLIN